MHKLTLTTEGDTGILVRRQFSAGPEAVFRAHVQAELIRKWLLGPDSDKMSVCVSEARPGGRIRFEWSDGEGNEFHMAGEYFEIDPHSRIVHLERMHLPEPTPDNHVETRFEPDGDGTMVTVRMTLPDAGMRNSMLQNGLDQSMESSYTCLDDLLADPAE